MSLVLYRHAFSSFCQKVLVAPDVNAIAFEIHLPSPAAARASLVRARGRRARPFRAFFPLGAPDRD